MCSHFTATVTACQALEGGRFAVTLDQTAFFPEGGGQGGGHVCWLPPEQAAQP